ncbi:MAG: acylphosphatase [bacterium]
MERLELTVYGRVQGVAFRWYTQLTATRLNVTGWVRNRPDGSVRLVAEGERSDLLALREWAGRGPDRARVDRVEESWGEPAGTFTDFSITG